VRREAEPRRFPARHFALLDRVAADIRPEEPALEEWYSGYLREHRARLAADLDIVESHAPPGARVLEYGAVPLLMTAALSDLGYELSAVDIGPERFAGTISRLGLEVVRCDVETESLPFPDEAFDLILFNELFEHLRINPAFTLREAHRALRPGGSLLLSTPNLRSFRGIRNLVLRNQGHAVSAGVYRQYEKLETLGHMGHVREYTTREVTEFLGHVGFRADKVIFRGGHGRGLVGLAERVAPALRPFFTLVASRDDPRAANPPSGGE
jgi:SAM-dependent methyltransferase